MHKVSAAALVSTVLSVSATAADVPFSGEISASSCTVVLLNGGTLAHATNGSTETMSSKNPGAIPGMVRVTNTEFARVIAPMSTIIWDVPATGDTGWWTDVRAFISGASVSGNGANQSEVDGNSGFNLSHSGGVTDVTVHLVATKNSGSFSTLPYSGVVPVTCTS